MQSLQSQPPCDCLARTAQTLDRFPKLHTRSSSDLQKLSLDEVLSLGADLVEQWELLHGCHVTDAHLDARMLQTMTEAVVQILTLYEVAAESIIGGWDETEEPHGGAGGTSVIESE